MRNEIAVNMAVCTHGSQHSEHVELWEKDGDYRRMTNGGN
jgi:hypothetical protein